MRRDCGIAPIVGCSLFSAGFGRLTSDLTLGERLAYGPSVGIASQSARVWTSLAAVSGALAVAMGAFGGHGLRNLVAPELLAVWRTAVDYQLFHTVALLACSLHSNGPRLHWPMRLWMLGIVLFSGSLYLLVLTGHRTFGIVTPFGGTAFILGWLGLALQMWRRSPAGR